MDLTGFGSVAELAGKIIDRVFPDPVARDAAKLEYFKAQQAGEFKEADAQLQLALAQLDINKVEAASESIFKSGWRPFIGWTCGSSYAYKFLLAPVLQAVLIAVGHPITLPVLDVSEMWPVLAALLGVGTLRTIEKLKTP